MTSIEVAEFLAVSTATLSRWRDRGDGPPWHKLGSIARYDANDVRMWLEGNRR